MIPAFLRPRPASSHRHDRSQANQPDEVVTTAARPRAPARQIDLICAPSWIVIKDHAGRSSGRAKRAAWCDSE